LLVENTSTRHSFYTLASRCTVIRYLFAGRHGCLPILQRS